MSVNVQIFDCCIGKQCVVCFIVDFCVFIINNYFLFLRRLNQKLRGSSNIRNPIFGLLILSGTEKVSQDLISQKKKRILFVANLTDQIYAGGQLLDIWQFIWTNIVQSRQVFNFNCKTLNHKINICSGPVYLVREGQTGQKMNQRKLKFCSVLTQYFVLAVWCHV